MDRFFEEESVRRYRKLRDRGTTETQRAMILKQLSKELEHFRCEITEATSFPAGRSSGQQLASGAEVVNQ
jgi:hypothetical protein